MNEETRIERYEVLGTIGETVAKAVEPLRFGLPVGLEMFSSLVLDAAAKLVKDSKPLDPEFSSVVDREFWNLLR